VFKAEGLFRQQLKRLENCDYGDECCLAMKTSLSNECCRLVEKFCLSTLFFACHLSFAEDPKPDSPQKAVPIIKDGETQIAP
ncbi:uncharacterized protein METZ01_LOCUS204689, partial [marine metagenome]